MGERHSRYRENRPVGEEIHPISLSHTAILQCSINYCARRRKATIRRNEVRTYGAIVPAGLYEHAIIVVGSTNPIFRTRLTASSIASCRVNLSGHRPAGELRELIEGFVEHGCHWVFEDVSNRTSIDWTVKLIPRSSFCITHGA